ncbi:hypothetical protein RGU12_00790 [Fredinandcohnia sp. QZ13]|uniref:hypothetical protein n=1 Tax=Fredinandcohnia sp. QZ13 TaxID=3073144 RepID=UPI0028533384|nr:hypothetical protein [Fredinandcohnia sp. QZ13]MDR4886080.1 hypothetical protein [Fredinandcohnia sp. QZ13]
MLDSSHEFYLSSAEKQLILKGIRNGLERFYKDREGKSALVTERNFISRQRASYVFDSIYHIANQHPELNVSPEIRTAGLSYEYVSLFFETRKIVVTFSQVKRPEDLPEYSEYRNEYTEGNRLYNPQLSFFREEDEFNLNIYKHLVVTFNGSHGPDPLFIWIGATTPEQNAWIYHEELTVDVGVGR